MESLRDGEVHLFNDDVVEPRSRYKLLHHWDGERGRRRWWCVGDVFWERRRLGWECGVCLDDHMSAIYSIERKMRRHRRCEDDQFPKRRRWFPSTTICSDARWCRSIPKRRRNWRGKRAVRLNGPLVPARGTNRTKGCPLVLVWATSRD
jgi:hypothetical protein